MSDPIPERRHSSRDTLISTMNEITKTYITYDGADRPDVIYTAPRFTKDGDRCIGVKYTYRDGTSQQVVTQTEFNAAWDSAWDVDVSSLEVVK